MSEQPLTYEGVLEMIREISRATKEQGAEFDRRMRKTELAMEKMCQEVGGLGNSIGRIIEHMLGERIIEKFQALGYNVTHPVVRVRFIISHGIKISGEQCPYKPV